jgi:hypothetical protein
LFLCRAEGDDRWSGQISAPHRSGHDGPFASLERARDAVRDLKRKGEWPADGVVVELSGGCYRLTRPLTLTAEDSGRDGAPVVYRARRAKRRR